MTVTRTKSARADKRRPPARTGAPAARPRPRSVLLAMEFYIHAVHEGVVEYARQAGWTLDAGMVHTHRVPEHWQGDGILCEAITRGMTRRLARFHRPIVGLVTPPPGLKCPSVLMDNERAARLAAEHFVERGFRRLAYFQTRSSLVIDARRDGFKGAALRKGCEFYSLDFGQASEAQHHRGHIPWLIEQLRRLPKPLGVMGSSDQWAIEVLNACRVVGIGVPEQVAVIGVDNDPLYVEVAPVPLSSVDNDLHRCGYEAAALLDRVMGQRSEGKGQRAAGGGHGGSPDSGKLKSLVVEPIGVIARRSTDILAVDEPHVGKALGFIFAHYRQPIRVGDAARHAGISLRKLQGLFQKVVGRTMVEQVTRLRLEHAGRLLLNTRHSIESIARQSGFSNGKYLGKVFAKEMGVSPRAYRKRGHEPHTPQHTP